MRRVVDYEVRYIKKRSWHKKLTRVLFPIYEDLGHGCGTSHFFNIQVRLQSEARSNS